MMNRRGRVRNDPEERRTAGPCELRSRGDYFPATVLKICISAFFGSF